MAPWMEGEPTDVVFALGKAFVAVSEEDVVKVCAVVLKSGNRTTVVNGNVILSNNDNLDPARLSALGLRDLE